MHDGIVTQNDPVNFIDPEGLELSTAGSFAIGAGTTTLTIALSFTPLAPIAPIIGAGVAAAATKIAGGDANQIVTNALGAGLGAYGGGLFGLGQAASAVRPGALALGLLGEYLLSLDLAGATPLPIFAEEDCP